MFGSIINARHGLTIPAAAVVAAVLLQVPTPYTSLLLIQQLNCYDSKISIALVVGVVLPFTLSSICDAVPVVLSGQLDKVQ